jgi:hypothetical protein
MARSATFDEARRRDAAKTALALDASLGERDRALEMRRELEALHPSARDVAEADLRTLAPERFWDAYRGRAGALDLVVEAAYSAARSRSAGGASVWLSRTVAAWDELHARDPKAAQTAPVVDHAAEAAFALLDEEIAARFDPATALASAMSVSAVFGDPRTHARGKFQLAADEASRWDLRLEREVVRKYESAPWVVAALARQGALFDALRTGLYGITRPTLFDASGQALLAKLRASGQDARADALEDLAADGWRARKQKELDAADEVMVRRYAEAVAAARLASVESKAVSRAIARLAYYTDLVGDAKLGVWVGRTPDPADRTGQTMLVYRERMYDRARPGLAPAPKGASPPRAAAGEPVVP